MRNEARKSDGKTNWEGPFHAAVVASKGAYCLERLSGQAVPRT